MEWLSDAPWWGGAGAVLLVVLWRMIGSQERARDPVEPRPEPPFGWIPRGTLDHAGLRWKLRLPNPGPLALGTDPPEVDVALPPRCPRCDLEVVQTRAFLSGYRYWCSSCGGSVHNRHPAGVLAAQAREIAS